MTVISIDTAHAIAPRPQRAAAVSGGHLAGHLVGHLGKRRLACTLGALGVVCVAAQPALGAPVRWQADAPGGAVQPDAAAGHGAITRGFEHVLPADALAFAGIADLDALGQALERQSWGKLWKDPACASLRADLEGRLQQVLTSANEKLDVDVEAALKELRGGLALAVCVEPPAEGQEVHDFEELRTNVLLVAGLDEDHEVLERTIARLMEQVSKESGVLTVRSGEIGPWESLEAHGELPKGVVDVRSVFTDDALVIELAFGGRTLIEDVLDELDGGGAIDVLADQPRFSSSVAAHQGGLQFWADGHQVFSLLEPEFERMAASKDDGAQIAAGLLLRSGLLGIDDLAASSMVDESGSRFELKLRWPSGGWLHEAFELLCVPGAFDTLAFSQADALSVSAMHIDFAGLFDLALKEALATGKVQMADVVTLMSEFEQGAGFALRDDLLESLNGQLTVMACEVEPTEAWPGATAPGAKPTNFVLMLGLKDGAAFNTLLEDLVRSRGLHAARERTEFQGFEMFNVTVFPGFALNYAVLPDMLVASLSPTLVQEVLRRSAGADLPRFADRKDVIALLGQLSEGRGMVGLSEASQNAYSMVAGLMAGLAVAGMGRNQSPDEVLSKLDLPELSVFEKHFKGLVANSLTVDDDGIWMEAVAP